LGQRLEAARRRRVLTQAELAETAGVSLITVSRLENDRHADQTRPATVRRLADALGVDAGWLMLGEEEGELGKAAA